MSIFETIILVFFIIVIVLFFIFRVFTNGEFNFYNLVSAFLIISFIIIIAVMASIIKKSNENNVSSVYPTIKQPCPDYWTLEENGDNKKDCVASDTNNGTFKANDTFSILNNYASLVSDIQANDGENKIRCQLKEWCNKNGIVWDGITNFNSC